MADTERQPVKDQGTAETKHTLLGENGQGAEHAAAQLARRLLAERERVTRFLDPDLFADPAYDILLDLFACGEEGRPVSMSSSACVARVARTTALRWVRLLELRGLIERYADEVDRRSTLLRLTDSARQSLMAYLRQIARARGVL